LGAAFERRSFFEGRDCGARRGGHGQTTIDERRRQEENDEAFRVDAIRRTAILAEDVRPSIHASGERRVP
jgi:hypothetical protein